MSSEHPETSEPQPTRAPDPRPARTRAAIKYAVGRLAERPGTDMTVNAITREAGVSRSAFYDQFSDLDALAIDMLAEVFRTYSTADTAALRAGTPSVVAATTALECLVDYLDEHRTFFVSSLEWRTSSRVPESVNEALAASYRDVFDAMGDAVPASINRDDAALFLAGGSITLIAAWMRTSSPAPKRELVERIIAQQPGWLLGA
ncbi:TetR/AcrR family transcriptional regulator [Gulosibacter massiliensis]|uniref:TetR/AcrR family transcriptional regulator n=1 Tax=Gulosibacter massiliensis TaxID=2479839 RepID=UPI000F63AA66|nr:TetR/AcrR family transcriptional regulator [Gulosibacter massiliensis]